MASENQLAANELNAQESTGPRTKTGKEIARGNSRKHGLASELPLAEASKSPLAKERKALWMKQFEVGDSFREYQVDLMVAASCQLEICWAEMRILEADHAFRAETVWDIDRRDEAYELAENLSVNPWRVARKLERTPHGCILLINLWGRLQDIVEESGAFTPEQRSLALDILGVRHDLRQGRTEVDPPGDVIDKKAWLQEMMQSEVDRLQSFMDDGLNESDDLRRELASQGSGWMYTPRGLILQRYARDAERRYYRAMSELELTRPAALQTSPPAATDQEELTVPQPRRPVPPNLADDAAEDSFEMRIHDHYIAALTRDSEEGLANSRHEEAIDRIVVNDDQPRGLGELETAEDLLAPIAGRKTLDC